MYEDILGGPKKLDNF